MTTVTAEQARHDPELIALAQLEVDALIKAEMERLHSRISELESQNKRMIDGFLNLDAVTEEIEYDEGSAKAIDIIKKLLEQAGVNSIREKRDREIRNKVRRECAEIAARHWNSGWDAHRDILVTIEKGN